MNVKGGHSFEQGFLKLCVATGYCPRGVACQCDRVEWILDPRIYVDNGTYVPLIIAYDGGSRILFITPARVDVGYLRGRRFGSAKYRPATFLLTYLPELPTAEVSSQMRDQEQI
ncbi:hypothetical protein EVAR_13717_1 [Eumeta japonica]|uniref:Uncharacterized protein n=1 Tax=Eumeta variegata TaxID=151549 RepID=A0A4C1UCB2_EUMVA|nr:hypothetical protein EVAR_13717_1 [Eumeta japonica]